MMSPNVLDTHIKGDHTSVRRVADWLVESGRVFEDQALNLSTCRELAVDWQGLAADAYENSASPMKEAAFKWADTVKRLGDRLTAYADELFDRQRDMSDHRWNARDAGLQVSDFLIFPPDPLEDVPLFSQDMSEEEKSSRAMLISRNNVLKQQWRTWEYLCEDVPHTHELFNSFAKRIADELNDIIALPDLDSILLDLGVNIATEMSSSYFRQQSFLAHSAAAAAAVRSANEWRRLGLNPTEAIKAGQSSRSAQSAFSSSKTTMTYAKWAGRAGVVGSFISAGVDIASGESPGSVAVGVGIGIATATATGAAAAGTVLSTGVISPAIAIGVTASVGAYAAKSAYEYYVPLRIRRKFIDEPIHDLMGHLGQQQREYVRKSNGNSDDSLPSFLTFPGGAL
ncbi:hypothetical protein [Schaalia vaccimaxillae]|uniref:hypothetical protein n=1 Tax=Schaalia vaccimaxillae TaxID=183916 RepID=UPI0003B7419A|nr:hypothetical protein [Schaalia vaccimaxillae]